jgi:hypothetical protein
MLTTMENYKTHEHQTWFRLQFPVSEDAETKTQESALRLRQMLSSANQDLGKEKEVKNHFLKWRDAKKGTPSLLDEYEQYISSPIVDVPDTDPRS